MSEPATNPLLQGIARALMNPIARDQAQSAVTMGQRMGDMLMAPAQAWKRMVDSGYQPTGQPNDPARDQMAADSMDVSGAVTVGGMPFARPGTLGSAGGKGIRAYHGSPHDFDRFDMSKIGTGEGAQAYGHGLYFAESEGVAKSYRNNLSNKTWGGNSFDPSDPRITAGMALDRTNGDAVAARGELMDAIKSYEQMGMADSASNARAALAHIDDGSALREQSSGRMYEVNIKADREDFLDWDTPLSQQSEKVRGAFPAELHGKPGSAAHDELAARLAPPVAEGADTGWTSVVNTINDKVQRRDLLSEKLRKAGIPGIKYLDAGSRTAGDGSRNYVLFRDDIIEVVRKYGVAAAASMFGMDAVMQAQTAEALQQ